MTSAYINANVSDTDAVQYEAYKKWSSAAIMGMVVVEGV
jgi:hypothetical protein